MKEELREAREILEDIHYQWSEPKPGTFKGMVQSLAGWLKKRDTRQSNEWVSVEDRLPAEYGTYIVCSDEAGIVWFMDYYGCGWESCDSDGESKIQRDDITHWQPLPEPPKEYRK